jgi:hypothetical protein
MPVTTGEWLGSAYAGWTGTALWFLVGTDIEGYPIPPAGTAYALVVSALNYWMVTPEPDPEARGSVFGGMFGPPLKAGIVPIVWDGTTWHFVSTHEAPAHAVRPFDGVIPFYTDKPLVPYFVAHGSLLWTLFPPHLNTRSGSKIVAIPILDHSLSPPFPSAEDLQDVLWLTLPTSLGILEVPSSYGATQFILENPYDFALIGDGGWNYFWSGGTALVSGRLVFYIAVDPRSLPDNWRHLPFVTLPFTRQQLAGYDGVITEDNWIRCAGYLQLGSQAITVNKPYSGFLYLLPYSPTQEQETIWVPVRALIIGSFRPPNRLRLRTALLIPQLQWTEFLIEATGFAIYELTNTPTGSRLVYRTGFARPVRLGFVPSVASPFLPSLRTMLSEILTTPRFVIYHHPFAERILSAEVDPHTDQMTYCSFRTVPHTGENPAIFAHEFVYRRGGEYEYRDGQPFSYRSTKVAGFAGRNWLPEATLVAGVGNWDDYFRYQNRPNPQLPDFVGHTLPQRDMMAASALNSFLYQELARLAARIAIGTVIAQQSDYYLDPFIGYSTDENPWVVQPYFVGSFTWPGNTWTVDPSSVWYALTHRLRVSRFNGRRTSLFECSLRIDLELGPELLTMLLSHPAMGLGDHPYPYEVGFSNSPFTIDGYFPQTFPNLRAIPPQYAFRVIWGGLAFAPKGWPWPPTDPPYIYFPYGLVYSEGETYRVVTHSLVGYLTEWRLNRVFDLWNPFPSERAVGVVLGAAAATGDDAFWLLSTDDPFTPYRLGWHGGHAASGPIAAFGQAFSFHPLTQFIGTCPIPLVFAPPFRDLFAQAGTVLVLNRLARWYPIAVFAGQAKDRSELSPMYWLVGAWRYRSSQFFQTNFPPDGQVRVPAPAVPVSSGYVAGTNFDGGWWQMPLAGTVYHPLFARAFAGSANRLLFFHQGWQQTLPAGRQKRLPDPFGAFLQVGTYNGSDYEVTGVRQIITMGHSKVQLLPRHAIWEGIVRVPYFRQDGGRCPLWQGEPILAVDGFPVDDGRVHAWVYTVYGVYSLLVTPNGVEDWSFDPLPRFLRAFVGRE